MCEKVQAGGKGCREENRRTAAGRAAVNKVRDGENSVKARVERQVHK